MSVTPLGNMSIAQEALRTALSESTAFQSWTNTSTAGAALLRIYHEGLPASSDGAFTVNEMNALRPLAIVYIDEIAGYSARRIGLDAWQHNYRGMIRLHQTASEVDHDGIPTSDETMRFRNAIGQILDDLRDNAGSTGHPDFTVVRLEAGPHCVADEAERERWGDDMSVVLAAEWVG